MIKEKIRHGTVLESVNEPNRLAHVISLNDSGIKVIINNKKDVILNEQLQYWKLANPIKDNRIISNYTFAIRFKQFLEWIPEKWWMSQPHYYEEYQYMLHIANRLIDYQVETVSDDEEIKYLKRLNVI